MEQDFDVESSDEELKEFMDDGDKNLLCDEEDAYSDNEDSFDNEEQDMLAALNTVKELATEAKVRRETLSIQPTIDTPLPGDEHFVEPERSASKLKIVLHQDEATAKPVLHIDTNNATEKTELRTEKEQSNGIKENQNTKDGRLSVKNDEKAQKLKTTWRDRNRSTANRYRDNIKTIQRESPRKVKKDEIDFKAIKATGVLIKSPENRKSGLLKTQFVNDGVSPKATRRLSMDRIELLSTPKASTTTRMFAKEDDLISCTFKPERRHKSSNDDYSSDSGFLSRTHAMESNRRKKLELTRGEEDYETRQDKKGCPKCDAVQSYAEFRDKKKKCPNCGVFFRAKKTWGNVGEGFVNRMEFEHKRREDNLEKIRQDVHYIEKEHNKVVKSERQIYYSKKLSKKSPRRSVTSPRESKRSD